MAANFSAPEFELEDRGMHSASLANSVAMGSLAIPGTLGGTGCWLGRVLRL